MNAAYSKYGPLGRGDWNEDKTKRFWGYRYGKEMWVTPERYEKSSWWK